MTGTLYEVQEHLQSLLDTVDMVDTDEQRQQCEDEIARTVARSMAKVDDFCRYLAHLESQAQLAQEEMERLAGRRDTFNRHKDRLRHYAIFVMQDMNLKRLTGDTSELRLRENPPSVDILDEDKVPQDYKTVVQRITIDKRMIAKVLRGGGSVPGAELKFGTVSLLRR